MAKQLPKLLDLLAKRYEAEGKKAELTELRDPFLLGAWFILGQHSKRNGQTRAYEALRRAKGVTPGKLLDIDPEKLHSISQIAGPYEEQRAKELYAYADAVEEKCGQDFSKIFKSANEATAFLKEELHRSNDFIEFLLLYGGGFSIFPTDDRIARVASRLGFGQTQQVEEKAKSKTTKVKIKKGTQVKSKTKVKVKVKVKTKTESDDSAESEVDQVIAIQKALEAECGKDLQTIIRAHGLLFRHAGDLCTFKSPSCDQCSLLKECPYGQANPVAPKATPTYPFQRRQ